MICIRTGAIRHVCSLGCLLWVLSLCGCAEAEFLTEIPETAVIEAGTETANVGSKEMENVSGDDTIEEAAEREPGLLYDKEFAYAYQCLSEAEQIWYQDIAQCLGAMQEEIRLDKAGIEQGLDETDIDKIFQCVLMDHPELFYVEGYTYTKYNRGEIMIAIEFSGTYRLNQEQAMARKEEIDQAVRPILNGAAGLANDYDKVKYVYETLICNTEYDLGAPDNQNIYSVFVNHKSVCQGYAKALQYLLDRMQVECVLVQGNVDTGEGHAWNLVKVNGSYYYVDATWGDASYQSAEETTNRYVPEINYDYLCVTTEQLLRTHILDSYVPLPACVDEKDNYYVREGALFTEYNREQMQRLFDKIITENRQDVTVKCADAECYRQIFTAMVDEQEVFDYLEKGSKSIAYTHNEKQLSMTFWVTNE